MVDHLVLWRHHQPLSITGGQDALAMLTTCLPSSGNILIVTSAGFTRRGATQRLAQLIGPDRVLVCDTISPNPELDRLDALALRYRDQDIAALVAIGGGSALDAGKVLGVTLKARGATPLDRHFRQGLSGDWTARIPVIAIPTTSGTGAEATPFATVWDSRTKKKHSLAHDHVLPTHALLVPELTLELPRRETLHSGLDAISHALESLWNRNRTPVSAAYAWHALALAGEALPVVLEQPQNLAMRTRMQQAGLLAGMAISQTRTAIAHAISYPLTIHFGVPHGLACGFTLSALIERQMQFLADSREALAMRTVQTVLNSLRLPEEMRHYVVEADVVGCLAEMFHPERATNFITEMREAYVEEILRKSLLP